MHPQSLRVSPPLVFQLALLRDIPEVQGIGVGLIRIRGTVAEHDDVPAGAKHLQEIVNRWGRLSPRRHSNERDDHECQAPPCGSHIPPPLLVHECDPDRR
jgi:hypothetical protein